MGSKSIISNSILAPVKSVILRISKNMNKSKSNDMSDLLHGSMEEGLNPALPLL